MSYELPKISPAIRALMGLQPQQQNCDPEPKKHEDPANQAVSTGVGAPTPPKCLLTTSTAPENACLTPKQRRARQGGLARSIALSPERRQIIAKAAAAKRWKERHDHRPSKSDR